MVKDQPITDIMTSNIKTVHPKERLSAAKEIFERYNVHHIVVEVMGELKGIISLGDLLFLQGMVSNTYDELLKAKKYQLATVDAIMTARPYHLMVTAMVSDALEIMINKRVNALPVLDDGKLVGLVTSYDMLKHLKASIQ